MRRAVPLLAFAVFAAAAIYELAHNPFVGLALILGAATVAVMISLNARGLTGPHWPLAAVGFLLPLNGLRPMASVTYGDIALVAAGFGALIVLRSARIPLIVLIVLFGTILITAGGLLGLIESQDVTGVDEMAKFILGAPAVILILCLLQPERPQVVMLLTAYAVGGTVSTVVGMITPVDPAFGRSIGLGAHMGHLALAAELSMFVWIAWALTSRRTAARILYAGLAALCLYGVLITGTRSALMGAAVGLGLVVIAHRGKGMLVAGGTALAGVAAYFVVVPLLPNASNLSRTFGQVEQSTQSNDEHAYALNQALSFIGDHPLTGAGFSHGLTAHNLELQVLSVAGIIGFVGLLLIWLPMGLCAVQRLVAGMDRESEMAFCCLAGVAAYWVFAQFQPLIWDRHLWFFIVLTLFLQHPFNEPLARVLRPLGGRRAEPAAA